MLNFRPVELKGLFVLLKDFVLVSALHGGNRPYSSSTTLTSACCVQSITYPSVR